MGRHGHRIGRNRFVHWLATRRTSVKLTLLGLVAYVGVYFFLSAAGRWRITRDTVQWEPFGASFYLRYTDQKKLIIRGSYLGYVYAPMTMLDRALIHPPISTDSPEANLAREQERQIHQREIDDRGDRFEHY